MHKVLKVVLILFGVILLLYFGGLLALWFIVRYFPFAP